MNDPWYIDRIGIYVLARQCREKNAFGDGRIYFSLLDFVDVSDDFTHYLLHFSGQSADAFCE